MISEIVLVPIEEVVENDWNPNEQEPEVFNELVEDIDTEGFDEPVQVVLISEDDPLYKQGKRYKIIGGAHRYKAVTVLGWNEIPITVKTYSTEDEQKVKTVRRNMLKGHLNRQKFTRLVNSLNSSIDNDLALKMGILSRDKLEAQMVNARGTYSPELAEKILEVKKEEVAIKNLSMILNKLFSEFGNTLKHSYMFFTYGTKLHLMLLMSRDLQKKIDGIIRYCEETDKDVNTTMAKIITIGVAAYKQKYNIEDLQE